ncbi:hypothetical protein FACS1894161_2440 [Spirochaetia bacterium]|nr:hypothetical protein FACS1894161_2440 [Spirochaetia bacterium]
MPQKRNPKWLAMLIPLTALMILIPSCRTTPEIEIIHEIPNVVFPVFPPPDSVTLDPDTELVSMPLWYWQKIAEYKIDVDALEEYLIRFREETSLQTGE